MTNTNKPKLSKDFSSLDDAKDALRKSERALKNALKSVRDADARTDERIAEVAHDIRASLSPLIGYSEILKDEYFGPHSSEKYRECAEILYVSANRLFDLCNSILNKLPENSNGSKVLNQVEFVDAGKTIDEIAKLFKELATQRGIDLTTKVIKKFPLLKMPPHHLYRALSNVVSNAMKFTPHGGKVVIEARMDKNEDALIMAVRNTGPGIPAQEIMEILKPFKSTESLYGEHGTGLGLPIVNKLMGDVGGKLEIQSNGTTIITLRFPKNLI